MKLTVASSPHIRGDFRTSRLMLDVVIALLPALAVGVYMLGLRALAVTAVCVVCAVGAEWLYHVLTRTRNTIIDGSALVTGVLLAMTLPHTVPYWLAAVGAVFAIVFVKLLCGGLGQNIFNPALTARAFMLLIYPVGMTRYVGIDGVTAATPLHHMVMPALPEQSILDMFLGNCPVPSARSLPWRCWPAVCTWWQERSFPPGFPWRIWLPLLSSPSSSTRPTRPLPGWLTPSSAAA